MNYRRRDFLRIGAGLAIGSALSPIACKTTSGIASGKSSIDKIGLQLYSLRDDIQKSPKEVLKQIASFGYSEVESFDSATGMFFGMSNVEFKKYINDLGLSIVSSHCDISKDFERKAAEAAAIGMKYLVCPWVGSQKTLDDYRKIADNFNTLGEVCRKNGIRFAYHNHAYSFRKHDGVYPQDLFMQISDKSIVDYEMDMYWVVTAGENVETWLKKYKDRFRLCHIKDRTKGATDESNSCTLGKGSIDYPPILTVAKETGMLYYNIEQERYDGTTPIKGAEDGVKYLKVVKI